MAKLMAKLMALSEYHPWRFHPTRRDATGLLHTHLVQRVIGSWTSLDRGSLITLDLVVYSRVI